MVRCTHLVPLRANTLDGALAHAPGKVSVGRTRAWCGTQSYSVGHRRGRAAAAAEAAAAAVAVMTTAVVAAATAKAASVRGGGGKHARWATAAGREREEEEGRGKPTRPSESTNHDHVTRCASLPDHVLT
jgi:hypothetical protein